MGLYVVATKLEEGGPEVYLTSLDNWRADLELARYFSERGVWRFVPDLSDYRVKRGQSPVYHRRLTISLAPDS